MPPPDAIAPSSAPYDSAGATTSGDRGAPPDHHALPAETIDRLGEDRDFVTALARGLAVMLALSGKRRRMSIAQVSHLTGIPRAGHYLDGQPEEKVIACRTMVDWARSLP